MTESSSLYRPKGKKPSEPKPEVPAITEATNAEGEVFRVGDRVKAGDLFPPVGIIDRFWMDRDNVLWGYYSPGDGDLEGKQWQLGVAKVERLKKAED